MKDAFEKNLLIVIVFCAVHFFSCPPTVHAAVYMFGDVSPSLPSLWNSNTTCWIGRSSVGQVIVDGGSVLQDYGCILGGNFGSQGTVMITGAGSKWTTNNLLYIGLNGNGTLNIEAGGQVTDGTAYLGCSPGSNGTATVSGIGSSWTSSNLYVAPSGSGTLTVADGGMVTVKYDLYASLNDLLGNGTISTKGVVMDADLIFDATHGLQQTMAYGTGGKLILNQQSGTLGVGYKGNGTLRIADGIIVPNSDGYLGYNSGSTGIATVTGTGSTLTTFRLYIGYSGSGTMNIESGGKVRTVNNGASSYLGYNSNATGIATVTGAGSTWTNSSLYVGYYGNGLLNIEAGGKVSGYSCYLGSNYGSTGTVMISGAGSTLDCSWLYVRNGTLNIGGDIFSGGVVITSDLTLSPSTSDNGTCNINNGGTLQFYTLMRGSGNANFNWNDGTIQSCNNNGNLNISSTLDIKLAATGTHNFKIDSSGTGTIDAILSDATINGTLNKTGTGTLTLTGVNTYSGRTTVEAGRFKVTGSILNTNGVTVNELATLELANTAGSATAANLAISNAGTLLISAGFQTVGAITGTGITQVNAGTSLTAQSIFQDSLIIGSSGVGTGMANVSTVPEPGTMILLSFGLMGLAAVAWRERMQ